MSFWSTRALYVRASHDTVTDTEWQVIRRRHAEEILYHVAHVVMSVTIAFFVGMKEGVIGVPSGLTLWQVISSGGAVWSLSPLEIENLVKGLLLEPEKFIRCTLLVLGVAGLMGGLRGAIEAIKESAPAVGHHILGVWNPKAEAIRYYNALPKAWYQKLFLASMAPLECIEALASVIIPPLPHWRVKILAI